MGNAKRKPIEEIEVKPVVNKAEGENEWFILYLKETGGDNRSVASYIDKTTAKRLLVAGNELVKKEVAGPHLYSLYNGLIKYITKSNRRVDRFVVDTIFDKKYYGNLHTSACNNSPSNEGEAETDLFLLYEGIILCVILGKPIFVTSNIFKATKARTDKILLESTRRKDMGQMQ